ncbi:MAG: acetate--CoA ligase family protein [Candidatus Hodarchaeota archaeon]
MTHFLDEMLNPQSIAFLGASNSITTMGTGQLYVLKSRYTGKIFPIHPSEETVLGLQAFKSIDKLPEVPDLLIMVLPTRLVTQYLEHAGQFGIPHVIIVSAGFSEVGRTNEQEYLNEVALRYGMRFLGPNCIGIINLHNPNGILNCTWLPFELERPHQGNISIVSQSGSWISQILVWAERRGFRLGKAISIGNEANVDLTDCLEYFKEDPETKVICAYVEGIKKEGKKFVSALKNLAKEKPVIINYAGGTEAGARAGMSHTASIGGKLEIYDSIIKQTGAIGASTIEELFEFAHAFSMVYPPKGKRIGLLSNSGGPAVTLADSCEKYGLEVPIFSKTLQNELKNLLPSTGSTKNPIDITFDMDFDRFYSKTPRVVWESGEVDALIFYGLFDNSMMNRMVNFANNAHKEIFPLDVMENVMKSFLDAFIEWVHKEKIPVMISCLETADNAKKYLQDNAIPVFGFPSMTVKAMKAVVSFYMKEKNL